MNLVRFLIAVAVVAVFLFFFEWTFHGMCMTAIYEQDPGWMRDPGGTLERVRWLFTGIVLMAIGFVLVWAMGFGGRGVFLGLIYGLALAVMAAGGQLLGYFSQPIPEAVIVRWVPAAFVELGLAGILTALIYRPKKRPPECNEQRSETSVVEADWVVLPEKGIPIE